METTPSSLCTSEAKRFRVEMLVELNDDTGVTRELSVCWVFFVTNRLFSAGEPVELTLVFEYVEPNHPIRLRCRGQVVHAEQRDGVMGVTVAMEAYRFETHDNLRL
jgi:hypothetical protein